MPPVVAVVLGFSVAAQLVEHGQSCGTEATVRVENKGREVHVVLVTLGFVLLVLLVFLRIEGAAVGIALECVGDVKVKGKRAIAVTKAVNDDVDFVARWKNDAGVGASVSVKFKAARVEQPAELGLQAAIVALTFANFSFWDLSFCANFLFLPRGQRGATPDILAKLSCNARPCPVVQRGRV